MTPRLVYTKRNRRSKVMIMQFIFDIWFVITWLFIRYLVHLSPLLFGIFVCGDSTDTLLRKKLEKFIYPGIIKSTTYLFITHTQYAGHYNSPSALAIQKCLLNDTNINFNPGKTFLFLFHNSPHNIIVDALLSFYLYCHINKWQYGA